MVDHQVSVSLSALAGVTFSPIDFSKFPIFSSIRMRPSEETNGSGERVNSVCDSQEFVFTEELEQEFCELVDMTVESDVVAYLKNEKLDELLQYVLFATDLPRIQVRFQPVASPLITPRTPRHS